MHVVFVVVKWDKMGKTNEKKKKNNLTHKIIINVQYYYSYSPKSLLFQ